MKFLLKFLILLLLSCTIIYSDDAENKIDARDLMEMDLDSAFKTIHKLNKEETDSLITKIRVEARKDYKEIDKFYLLISHLESMKAIEEEEKKLKDLNLVYILGLVLVVGVIGYTLFSQRKAIDTIKHLSSE